MMDPAYWKHRAQDQAIELVAWRTHPFRMWWRMWMKYLRDWRTAWERSKR